MNPLLIASFLAAVVVDVAAPALLAVWIARRWKLPARLWLCGAGVFLLFQLLTRVPLVAFLQTRPSVQAALHGPPARYALVVLALSLSAGLFEEGGRWLGYRLVVRERDRNAALLYGAGHGGLESIGIGLLTLASLAAYITLMKGLPAEAAAVLTPDQVQKVEEARSTYAALRSWEPLLGGWERLMALPVQMALALVVLQSFLRSTRWWWLALAAHTWLDLSAVLTLRFATTAWGAPLGKLAAEALITVYGLAALGVLARLGRSRPTTAPPP